MGSNGLVRKGRCALPLRNDTVPIADYVAYERAVYIREHRFNPDGKSDRQLGGRLCRLVLRLPAAEWLMARLVLAAIAPKNVWMLAGMR